MSSFAVDGKQLYFEHHRGTKAPVVLVHGWAATSRSWNTVLLALVGAGHEVVTLDQRGCGKSDNDFDDFGIDALGNDVVALVNDLTLDRPVINGWSLGGAVAATPRPSSATTCAGWCSPAARHPATPRPRTGPTAAVLRMSKQCSVRRR